MNLPKSATDDLVLKLLQNPFLSTLSFVETKRAIKKVRPCPCIDFTKLLNRSILPNLTQPYPVLPSLTQHYPALHTPTQPRRALPSPTQPCPALPYPVLHTLTQPRPSIPSPAQPYPAPLFCKREYQVEKLRYATLFRHQ